MALDQQTLQVLQEISASIRSIHVLMQQSSARQQGPSGPSDPQGPEPSGSRRPGPAEWFGQNVSGITSNLNYRQHYPSPYSYPGMAGHMSHMGHMGMGMGMWPSMHGHVPGREKEEGENKKELIDVISKLIDTLKKFSDDFEKAGFGTGGGTSGKKTKPMPFSSLGKKWESDWLEEESQTILKGAKDEAHKKFIEDRERKQRRAMPLRSKIAGIAGAAIEGVARTGMTIGSVMAAMYQTDGKDPAIGQGAQHLSKSLMAIGGRVGAFGNALSIVTTALQSMKSFADNAHRMNMRLSEWSPSMARVAVYSEVEQIMSDQRKGEARAGSAMRLAKARAEMTKDTEEITNDIANIANDVAAAGAKTVGFAGTLYSGFKALGARAGLMSPEAQARWIEEEAKRDPEIAKILGLHGKDFSEGVKDIMNAKWIESYGAAAHWKNWTDD